MRNYSIDTEFKGNKYRVSLDFRSYKALIMGDSAVGKSLVYQIIAKEANVGKIEARCYNHASVRALKDALVSGHFTFKNSLVIIDNADILFYQVPSLVEEINTNFSNNYLILARRAVKLDASPNVVGELKYEGTVFSIEYLYPEGVWA